MSNVLIVFSFSCFRFILFVPMFVFLCSFVTSFIINRYCIINNKFDHNIGVDSSCARDNEHLGQLSHWLVIKFYWRTPHNIHIFLSSSSSSLFWICFIFRHSSFDLYLFSVRSSHVRSLTAVHRSEMMGDEKKVREKTELNKQIRTRPLFCSVVAVGRNFLLSLPLSFNLLCAVVTRDCH